MTKPQIAGVCNKCDDDYEVWNFDEYGNSRLCSSCHCDLSDCDRMGLPHYSKPLDGKEEIVVDTLRNELGVKIWETEWRIYLHW